MNIWVNGCFDILHTGHLDLLWFAKLYKTDRSLPYEERKKQNNLYVGLDNDKRVKELKGDDRPINGISTRLTLVSDLKPVDHVCVFNTNEELKFFIQSYEIDYMIVGSDYREKRVIGSEFAKLGVDYYEIKDGNSTTRTITKIKTI